MQKFSKARKQRPAKAWLAQAANADKTIGVPVLWLNAMKTLTHDSSFLLHYTIYTRTRFLLFVAAHLPLCSGDSCQKRVDKSDVTVGGPSDECLNKVVFYSLCAATCCGPDTEAMAAEMTVL